jgi:hypothetical protein
MERSFAVFDATKRKNKHAMFLHFHRVETSVEKGRDKKGRDKKGRDKKVVARMRVAPEARTISQQRPLPTRDRHAKTTSENSTACNCEVLVLGAPCRAIKPNFATTHMKGLSCAVRTI